MADGNYQSAGYLFNADFYPNSTDLKLSSANAVERSLDRSKFAADAIILTEISGFIE